MAEYTGSFDTGVDGASVTTSDTGSYRAWDDRAFTAPNSTLTYSSTQKYAKLSCQMVFSATPTGAYVAWNSATLGSSLTSLWGRIYMHHSGLPNTFAFPIRGFDGGTLAWQLCLDASGFVVLRDTAGTFVGQGAVAIATGQWIRIEFHVVNSPTAGVMQAKLFNSADSTTVSETITATGSFSTLSKTDLLRFGDPAGINASRTIYMDNILVNDTGYPGPLYGTSYHSNVQGDSPSLYWKLDEAAGNFENSGTLGSSLPISIFNGNYGYREEPAVGENYSTLNGGGAAINAAMTFTDPNVWTLEAWVKPTAIPPAGGRGIIELGNHAPVLRVEGATQRLELAKNSVSTDGFSTAPIEIGKWQHVVARRTGGVSSLFINGIDRSGSMSNPTYEQSIQLTGFGGQWVVRPDGGGLTPNSEFIGFIDEVAVYDYALSDARILAHYNAGRVFVATATFETGVQGALPLPADAGSGTPWDERNQPGIGSLVYDNTHAYGRMAAKIITPGTGSSLNVAWTTALGSPTDHYGRVYMYLPSVPTDDVRFITAIGFRIDIKADGLIRLLRTAGFFVADSAVRYPTNQWFRLEWHVVHSTTAGVVEARMFSSPDSAIATDSFGGTGDTGTSCDALYFGDAGGNAAVATIWFDNIVAGAPYWVGPVDGTPQSGVSLEGVGLGRW